MHPKKFMATYCYGLLNPGIALVLLCYRCTAWQGALHVHACTQLASRTIWAPHSYMAKARMEEVIYNASPQLVLSTSRGEAPLTHKHQRWLSTPMVLKETHRNSILSRPGGKCTAARSSTVLPRAQATARSAGDSDSGPFSQISTRPAPCRPQAAGSGAATRRSSRSRRMGALTALFESGARR